MKKSLLLALLLSLVAAHSFAAIATVPNGQWSTVKGVINSNFAQTVIGPASATDGYIPTFDGTTGKVVKLSTCYVDATGLHCTVADGSRYATLPNNTSQPSSASVVNGFYTYLNEMYLVESSGTAQKISTPSRTETLSNKTLASFELGSGSTDTTVTRDSAGVMAVEGVPQTRTIASGTSALGTSAISSGQCATVVTTTATGTATTDVINWGFNGDPTAVTGYTPSSNGMLTIIAYP